MERLTYRDPLYVWEGGFESKDLPKAAGFRWHGGNCYTGCLACKHGIGKVWWTNDAGKAAKLIKYADEAAKAQLTGRIVSVEASRATDAQVEIPAPEGLSYMPFQRAGIAYAMGRENVLIGDEMGLGKTIQALGVINADATIQSVLVICPASLRLNWLRESRRWLVRPLRSYLADTPKTPPEDAQLIVTNYERASAKSPLATALLARKWDLIVVDEGHYCKSHDSKRTQAILGIPARKDTPEVPGLIHRARRRIVLTGTPIVNRPVEFFSILHALAPATFPNFFGYAKRYCDASQTRYGWNFSGSSHLDELQEKVRATCMVRRLKKDVLTELPAKVRQVIELPRSEESEEAVEAEWAEWAPAEERINDAQDEMDAAHAMGDKNAYEAAVAKLRESYREAFTAMSRARHALAMAKAPAVAEHVAEMLENGTRKVVLMAHHHDVIASLAQALADYHPVTLTGETAMADRQAAVDRFQSDETCRVFIGSIQAAGVGITLTAASTVAFAELDWVPGNMSQAEDRLHRIGQKDSVHVLHLVFDRSLDARLAKALVEKQAVLDAALDEIPEPIRMDTIRKSESSKENGEKRESEKRPRQYQVASDEKRAAALQAMRMVAGMCDGARKLDGCGFNRNDTTVGHRLAELTSLTDGQVWLASKLARKYQRQLSDEILTALGIQRKEK